MDGERCDLLCLDLERAEGLRRNRLDLSVAVGRAAQAGALGDPSRLQILCALRDGGELCVCDLAWIMERSDALVSHHLRVLRTAGLVASRRDGKMVMYRLVGQGELLLDVLIPRGKAVPA